MRRRHARCATRPRFVGVGLVLIASIAVGCGRSSPPESQAAKLRAAERTAAAATLRLRAFPKGAAAHTRGKPPPVPSDGAYFGAWVQPLSYTQQGRSDAVVTFESALNRRLDIVHTYRRETETFPTASDFAAARNGSYLLLSWAIDDAQRIASGAEDEFVRSRAREIRSFGYPIFLEFQWEMDRPNLASVVDGPATYIAAWRHVHQIFASMHVNNVSWVWCPTAAGFADGRAPAYYPGDDEVDWTCADAYPGGQAPKEPLATLIGPYLAWAAQNGKPAMLGEFGITHAVSPADRATWLGQARATIAAHPQIKAVVYFDSGVRSTDPALDFSVAAPDPAFGVFRSWVDSPEFDPQDLTRS
jgi:hypothetical protein